MSTSWFERLTGFPEVSTAQVHSNLYLDRTDIVSKVNGRRLRFGRLETPTLSELRQSLQQVDIARGPISVDEIVSDSQTLHADPSVRGALFQVASQFNLLEMVSPSVTPEDGVSIYEKDHTQGPASAIAAGAGTIYRNYFAPVNGQVGQSEHCQIDCLDSMGRLLGNESNRLWVMKNGYTLASESGLKHLSDSILNSSDRRLQELRESLKIGVQWDTEITLKDHGHLVSQAYCSALPVAYSTHSPAVWEPFARLVLEATYEATLCAAAVNYARTGNELVYLTLVGGGVFGNDTGWILDAIERALSLFESYPLEVKIVSYGRPNPSLGRIL